MPRPNGAAIAQQIAGDLSSNTRVRADVDRLLNDAVGYVNLQTRVIASTRGTRAKAFSSRPNRLNNGYTQHIRWERIPNGIRLNIEELNVLTQVAKSRNPVWIIQEVGTGKSAVFVGVGRQGEFQWFPAQVSARSGDKISPQLQWHTGTNWVRPQPAGGTDQIENVFNVASRGSFEGVEEAQVRQRRGRGRASASGGGLPVRDVDGRRIAHSITIRREAEGKDIVRDAGRLLQAFIRTRLDS